MITRLTGNLESVDGIRAVVAHEDGAVAYEVLVPAFLGVALASRVGQRITLQTLEYLEGQGQGTSFVPRLVGFESPIEREFFELLTSVSGIGNRKALRAFAQKPGVIARAVQDKDARLLSTLPEIGKRMAERVIAELDGKVEAYLASPGAEGAGAFTSETKPSHRSSLDPLTEDALAALMALGQTRAEAEGNIRRAMERGKGRDGKPATTPTSVEDLLRAVFSP